MAGCGCCAPSCPPCINITFNDVAFDCGCISDLTLNGSWKYTDLGLNGTPITLSEDVITGFECAGTLECDLNAKAITFPISVSFWASGNTTCLGAPSFIFSGAGYIYLFKVSGNWYCMAFLKSASILDAVFFLGRTTDLSIPMTNEAFCAERRSWDNPAWICQGSVQKIGAAEGGTATFTTDC